MDPWMADANMKRDVNLLSNKFKGTKKNKGKEEGGSNWVDEADDADLGKLRNYVYLRTWSDAMLKNLKVEMRHKTRKRNHTYELIHSDLERRKTRERKLGPMGWRNR
jgi:hypothetical protein